MSGSDRDLLEEGVHELLVVDVGHGLAAGVEGSILGEGDHVIHLRFPTCSHQVQFFHAPEVSSDECVDEIGPNHVLERTGDRRKGQKRRIFFSPLFFPLNFDCSGRVSAQHCCSRLTDPFQKRERHGRWQGKKSFDKAAAIHGTCDGPVWCHTAA